MALFLLRSKKLFVSFLSILNLWYSKEQSRLLWCWTASLGDCRMVRKQLSTFAYSTMFLSTTPIACDQTTQGRMYDSPYHISEEAWCLAVWLWSECARPSWGCESRGESRQLISTFRWLFFCQAVQQWVPYVAVRFVWSMCYSCWCLNSLTWATLRFPLSIKAKSSYFPTVLFVSCSNDNVGSL